METLWKSWSGNRVWTVHHLETPGRSWKSIEESRSTKKSGKPKLHKTSKNKSRQGHSRAQKNKQVSQMHALDFMTKTIQTYPDRLLQSPRENPQKTIRKNIEWQEDQITPPSHFLLLPTKQSHPATSNCSPNNLTQLLKTATHMVSPSHLKLAPEQSHPGL